jgi:transglutaminase-like putative cysteine protease
VAWERVSATVAGLRGPTALDVAPFARPSRFVTVAANRLGSVRSGVGVVHAGPSDRRGDDGVLQRDLRDVRVRPVVHRGHATRRRAAERRGVCQDFAHLAVGSLRAIGLAARYVSGYIETDPPPGEPKVFGADASHAWCSIWIPDHGWLDFDPTNGVVAPSRHVTIGWGRDYADVAPVRGVVVGPSSEQSLTVSVDVARI